MSAVPDLRILRSKHTALEHTCRILNISLSTGRTFKDVQYICAPTPVRECAPVGLAVASPEMACEND